MRFFLPEKPPYSVAPFLEQVLCYTSLALSCAVFVRILWSRLFSLPLRAFTLQLGVGIARDVLLLLIPYDSHAYAAAWEWTLIPVLVAQALSALATYAAIAGLYPRIGKFAVYLFAGSLTMAAAICFVVVPFESLRMSGEEADLRTLFLVQRCTASVIAGGLLLAVSALSYFPRPLKRLPRNVVLHSAFLCAYFVSNSVLYLVENMNRLGSMIWVEELHFGVLIALFAGWTFGLSRAGERMERWPPIPSEVSALIERRNQEAIELSAKLAQISMHYARK